jgi:hypothetical protein
VEGLCECPGTPLLDVARSHHHEAALQARWTVPGMNHQNALAACAAGRRAGSACAAIQHWHAHMQVSTLYIGHDILMPAARLSRDTSTPVRRRRGRRDSYCNGSEVPNPCRGH